MLILLSFTVGWIGIVVGAALTINVLWWVAPGTSIRPMLLALQLMILSLATAILGTGLGIASLFFSHRRWKLVYLSVLAIFCSYLPLFVAKAIATWIISAHHLILDG